MKELSLKVKTQIEWDAAVNDMKKKALLKEIYNYKVSGDAVKEELDYFIKVNFDDKFLLDNIKDIAKKVYVTFLNSILDNKDSSDGAIEWAKIMKDIILQSRLFNKIETKEDYIDAIANGLVASKLLVELSEDFKEEDEE
jgi:hypothetical protein